MSTVRVRMDEVPVGVLYVSVYMPESSRSMLESSQLSLVGKGYVGYVAYVGYVGGLSCVS